MRKVIRSSSNLVPPLRAQGRSAEWPDPQRTRTRPGRGTLTGCSREGHANGPVRTDIASSRNVARNGHRTRRRRRPKHGGIFEWLRRRACGLCARQSGHFILGGPSIRPARRGCRRQTAHRRTSARTTSSAHRVDDGERSAVGYAYANRTDAYFTGTDRPPNVARSPAGALRAAERSPCLHVNSHD